MRRSAISLLLALGCTGDPGDTDLPEDPAAVELRGPCNLEDDLGGFLVEAYDDYSIVAGKVRDGVVPITVLEEVAAEGDCRALQRNNPWCDPPCGGDETCDFTGECIPYPVTQDLGTVTIAGLAAPVSMDPVSPGYTYFDNAIDHPAFAADALVQLDTSAATWEPVRLHGVGAEALVLHQELLLLYAGRPLELTWDPPTGLGRASVDLVLSVDQHGNTPVSLQCTFTDDGAAEVPAALAELVVRAGVTGFPSGTVSRRTADSVTLGTDGCLDLTVAWSRLPDVRVDGYIPCHDDEDCPEGQKCNLATEICEAP